MLLTPTTQRASSRELLDVLIRAGLVAVLAIFCFRIFAPFLNLMVWALILAITLYPLQVRLRRGFGNKDGLTATLIILIAFVVILVPTYLLGVAVAELIDHAKDIFKSGSFRVPPPAESVTSWPLVGQKVYDFWQQASTDISGLAQKFAPQVKEAGLALLGTITGLGAGLLLFFAALTVAGILMAYGETGHKSAVEIASRIFGPDNGAQIADLCTATIRAVAQGVVGIAFIQMLLIGVAFIVMGIPGAGLLALAVLLIGIMQLPATLITIPVIVFVIVTEGVSAITIIFSVYVFVAGLADNLLKPMMLGRGVAVPMPVVLIGALGGMVTGGVIGLFIGARDVGSRLSAVLAMGEGPAATAIRGSGIGALLRLRRRLRVAFHALIWHGGTVWRSLRERSASAWVPTVSRNMRNGMNTGAAHRSGKSRSW